MSALSNRRIRRQSKVVVSPIRMLFRGIGVFGFVVLGALVLGNIKSDGRG